MKILKINNRKHSVKVKLGMREYNKFQNSQIIPNNYLYIKDVKRGTFFKKYKWDNMENIITVFFSKEKPLESYINYFFNYVLSKEGDFDPRKLEKINVIDRNLKLMKIKSKYERNK